MSKAEKLVNNFKESTVGFTKDLPKYEWSIFKEQLEQFGEECFNAGREPHDVRFLTKKYPTFQDFNK